MMLASDLRSICVCIFHGINYTLSMNYLKVFDFAEPAVGQPDCKVEFPKLSTTAECCIDLKSSEKYSKATVSAYRIAFTDFSRILSGRKEATINTK